VISLYKKGSRKDPGNYREISVNNNLNRLFVKITINFRKSQSTLLAKIKMISVQVEDM